MSSCHAFIWETKCRRYVSIISFFSEKLVQSIFLDLTPTQLLYVAPALWNMYLVKISAYSVESPATKA